MEDLKRELKQHDSSAEKSGTLHAHEISPSQFIIQALEIEEQQYVNRVV